jgi:hypothetical protein
MVSRSGNTLAPYGSLLSVTFQDSQGTSVRWKSPHKGRNQRLAYNVRHVDGEIKAVAFEKMTRLFADADAMIAAYWAEMAANAATKDKYSGAHVQARRFHSLGRGSNETKARRRRTTRHHWHSRRQSSHRHLRIRYNIRPCDGVVGRDHGQENDLWIDSGRIFVEGGSVVKDPGAAVAESALLKAESSVK